MPNCPSQMRVTCSTQNTPSMNVLESTKIQPISMEDVEKFIGKTK
jgi:hypothetical protein